MHNMDYTLLINAIATPLLVILTLWVRSMVSSKERSEKREDKFIADLERRLQSVEQELKVVRVELKNRDKDYLELYKEHTTLKAKYEVLMADHEELKKQYEHTVSELSRLGNSCSLEHAKSV